MTPGRPRPTSASEAPPLVVHPCSAGLGGGQVVGFTDPFIVPCAFNTNGP